MQSRAFHCCRRQHRRLFLECLFGRRIALRQLSLQLAGGAAYANDIDPFGFEKEHFIASASRADVVSDLKAAQAAGQLLAPGEVGERFVDAPSVKTRAQVVAETREAKRLGLITYGELVRSKKSRRTFRSRRNDRNSAFRQAELDVQ
jgi:hypothetical protein